MQFNPDNQDFQGEQEWDGPRQSWMIKLVMKTGLVKDESQTTYVLIGVAMLFFVLTIITLSSRNDSTVPVEGPSTEIGESVEIFDAETGELIEI